MSSPVACTNIISANSTIATGSTTPKAERPNPLHRRQSRDRREHDPSTSGRAAMASHGAAPPVSGNGSSATSSSLGSTTSGGDPALPAATVAGSVDSLPHTETPSGVIFTEVESTVVPPASSVAARNDIRNVPAKLRRQRGTCRDRLVQDRSPKPHRRSASTDADRVS